MPCHPSQASVHAFHILSVLGVGVGQCHHILVATAASSGAAPDARVVQRQALLRRLGLSTSHYLKLQPSTGTGQQAGQQHTASGAVHIQPLLNTACICLMPDHLAYQWWCAPSAVDHPPSPHQPQASVQGRADAATPSSPAAFPWQVEVRGVSASTLRHNLSNSSTSKARAGEPSSTLQDKAHRTDQQTQSSTPSHSAQAASETGAVTPGVQEQPALPPSAVLASSHQPIPASCLQGDTGQGADSHTDSDGGPFECSPVHVQLQVVHSLRRLLTSKLDAMAGGPAEEDRILAQQQGGYPVAQMALRYRAGQKKIAAAALAALAATAAGVVQRAAAGLGLGSGSRQQPSSPAEVGQPPMHCCQCTHVFAVSKLLSVLNPTP